MRLIIQIPAYDEQETLALTLSQLPRKLTGIDQIEYLVIDDGSTDATAQIARDFGVHHLLSFSRHRGLAAAFAAGLETCLELGADLIVNTDADNQYCAADISRLIEPILRGNADMVVGTRPIHEMNFSAAKKSLQALGSFVVRQLSGTTVEDCTSGFRAYRREAARQLKVFGNYTYTLETIIHAGRKGMAVVSVPIRTNRVTRPSRLVKSIPSYVLRSALTILRHYCFYRPVTAFIVPGVLLMASGIGLPLSCFLAGREAMGLLVIGVGLFCTGFLCVALGFVADWFAMSRKVLEGLERQVVALRDPAARRAEMPTEVRSSFPISRASKKALPPEFVAYLSRREMTLESRV